jgi:hypothetical protein
MTEASRIDPDFFFDLTGADGRPVLAVAGDGVVPLTLVFRNRTDRSHRFEAPPPGTVPGPEWYHFSLAFRPGVLSETTLSMLADDGAAEALLGPAAARWSVACPDPGPGAAVTLYFLLTVPQDAPDWTVRPDGSGTAGLGAIALHGITAHPTLAGQGTRVQLRTWAIAPEGDAGHRTPCEMTRRIAIVHPRLPAAGSHPVPLELALRTPFAIPVSRQTTDDRCGFILRNVSDSRILRGQMHMAITIEPGSDLFSRGLPGGLIEVASLAAVPADDTAPALPIPRQTEASGATETLRWPLPIPQQGLASGAAIALQANLPSEIEGPLDIAIEYDLEGFGAGRRVFTFMRSRAAAIWREHEALERQVRTLTAQFQVLRGLRTAEGTAGSTSLKWPEGHPDERFKFAFVLDTPAAVQFRLAGYPLVERIRFMQNGTWKGAGNGANDLELSIPYRSGDRPQGEMHYYACPHPRLEAGTLLLFIAVGETQFKYRARFAPGETEYRMLLTEMVGPFLSEGDALAEVGGG